MWKEKIFRKISKFFEGVTVYDVLISVCLGTMVLCAIALLVFLIYLIASGQLIVV